MYSPSTPFKLPGGTEKNPLAVAVLKTSSFACCGIVGPNVSPVLIPPSIGYVPLVIYLYHHN